MTWNHNETYEQKREREQREIKERHDQWERDDLERERDDAQAKLRRHKDECRREANRHAESVEELQLMVDDLDNSLTAEKGKVTRLIEALREAEPHIRGQGSAGALAKVRAAIKKIEEE